MSWTLFLQILILDVATILAVGAVIIEIRKAGH